MGRPGRPRRRKRGDERRRRGTGSLSYHRPSGSWRAQLPRALDPARTPRYFPTREAGAAWLAAELARARGDPTAPGGPGQTLAAWLDGWLGRREPPPGAPRQTWHGYRTAAAAAEPLWTVPLDRLTHLHFEQLLTDLERRGLRPATVSAYRRALNVALNDAVKARLIPDNPLRLARPTRLERSEVAVLDAADVARFLRQADRHPLAALWRLLVTLGPRPGEARGLRWEDLDLEADPPTVAIRRSHGDRDGAIGPTKTRRERVLILPAPCAAALRRHRAAQAVASPWVFVNPGTGRPWSAGAIRDAYKALRRAAGVKPVKLQALRHSAATALVQRWPLPEAARILGHSNPSITARIYTRALDRNQAEIAAWLGERLPETADETGD